MTKALAMQSADALTLEQKVGQLVMIDFSGPAVPDWLAQSFARHHWGGVILFAKNLRDRDQVAALCRDLQAVGGQPWPLFIGIDQEGGIVDRLPFDELASLPGAMALGATGNPTYAYDTAYASGLELRQLGINLNFAPCVDINDNPLNPIIGVRSYGETAEQVVRFAFKAASGYRAAGVIPCAKHFPGHGDTTLDSHLSLPVVRHERARLDNVELAPYRALFADGLETVMTAHIVYPALGTGDRPATLSRAVLTDLLREELGFDGVVITDSMSMKAIADNYGVGRAACYAIEAGADIVLACGTREQHEETVRALIDAVRQGEISERRLDASIERIMALKSRLAGAVATPAPSASAAGAMDEAAQRSITLVRNDGTLPFARHQKVLLVAPSLLPVSQLGEIGASFPLAKALTEAGVDVTEVTFSLEEENPDVLEACHAGTAATDIIALCLYARGRLSEYQKELATALSRTNRPMVVVSLNSPYLLMDIPQVRSYVCTYGYARRSIVALAHVLCGKESPQGKLPISIPRMHARGDGLSYR